jgi:hypothetical protein
MKIIDYIEDNCPDYALSYLVNGDASGMEDEDVANCDEWLKSFSEKMARDYPGLKTDLVFDDNAEPSFYRYPAFGLACNCVPCAFIAWAENDSPLKAIALPWEEENEEGNEEN